MAMMNAQNTELAALANPNPFRWDALHEEPKVMRRCLKRAHRTMEYEILHTGGFVRLCTERGRIYWLAQNEHDHRLPDWKLHFSVMPQDVPIAWDVLSALFMESACDFGMKAVCEKALESWPYRQRGREITVYVFQDDPAFAEHIDGPGGPLGLRLCPKGSEHNFWLGPEFERPASFWASFVDTAERALNRRGVRSHGGCASGDLPLGRYASLRNEAFIPKLSVRDSETFEDFEYPPNSAGWNAAQHRCPLNVSRFARVRAALLRTPRIQ